MDPILKRIYIAVLKYNFPITNAYKNIVTEADSEEVDLLVGDSLVVTLRPVPEKDTSWTNPEDRLQ